MTLLPRAMQSAGSGGRIHALDGLRGLAALTVFFWHTLDVFDPMSIIYNPQQVLQYPSSTVRYLLNTYPLGWMVNGIFAVGLFFVLSGFVLTYILHASNQFHRCHEYVARRILRLFPVVAIGSIIGYIVLRFGWFFLDELAAVNGVTNAGVYPMEFIMHPNLGELLRQMTISVWTSVNSQRFYDRVLWTLGMELRCSLLIFLLITVFRHVRSRALAYAIIAYVGTILCGSDFLYFAAGSFLADCHFHKRIPLWMRSKALLAVILVLSLSIACINPSMSGKLWQWGFVSMLPFSQYSLLLLYCSASVGLVLSALYHPFFVAILTSRIVAFFGFISYAFFAIHQPLLYSLGAGSYLRLLTGMDSTLALPIAILITFVISIAIAFMVTLFIDHPLNAIAKRVVGRLLVQRETTQ